MAYGLTLAGFVPKPLPIIKAELDDAFKAVYGANIGSEPDGSIPAQSAIGQFIGIFAGDLADLWELLQAVNSATDPDKAEGAALHAIGALTGTIALGERPSVALITATGNPGTVLALGRVVSAVGSRTRFATLAAATITALAQWTAATAYFPGDRVYNGARVYYCIGGGNSAGPGGPTGTGNNITDNTVIWGYLGEGTGAIDVLSAAEVVGAFAALGGTLTQIETPVTGWLTAINLADAIVGALAESDVAFRIRRENELQGQGRAAKNPIRANVLKVGQGGPNPVTACSVFSNSTMVTDAQGLPPKSVEVLALGGADQDVRVAVFENVADGIETFGNNSGSVTDTAGNPWVVKFSRPTRVNIYIDFDVRKDPSAFPLDGVAQIKERVLGALQYWSFGKDATAFAAQGAIGPHYRPDLGQWFAGVPGVLDVVTRVGTTATPLATVVPIAVREIARFDSSRIVVNLTDGVP